MTDFENSLPITVRLHSEEFARLKKREAQVEKQLRACGFGEKRIGRSLQLDFENALERKSAISPYEAYRAAHILRSSVGLMRLDESDGIAFTVALPHRRKTLSDYSPEKAFRKWRDAVRVLKDRGRNPIGFCFLEINQLREHDADPIYEPHLHGALWCVEAEELRAAFKVRKRAKGTRRNRPTYLREVYDLNGHLDYLTKFAPEYRQEPKVQSPKGRWLRGTIAGSDGTEWFEFMSRYRVSELIKLRGIDVGDLADDGTSELVTVPELSSNGPKGGRKGPSRPRGRR